MKRLLIVLMCVMLVLSACSSNTDKTIGDERNDGPVVFISPTGTKFHLSNNCAGARAKPVYYGQINKYYRPCKKCVQHYLDKSK